MNIHKVLLGAILIKPDLAPYSLPDLEKKRRKALYWKSAFLKLLINMERH